MGETLHPGHIGAAKTQPPGLMEAVRTRQSCAGPKLLLGAYSGLCGELVVLLSQAPLYQECGVPRPNRQPRAPTTHSHPPSSVVFPQRKSICLW